MTNGWFDVGYRDGKEWCHHVSDSEIENVKQYLQEHSNIFSWDENLPEVNRLADSYSQENDFNINKYFQGFLKGIEEATFKFTGDEPMNI